MEEGVQARGGYWVADGGDEQLGSGIPMSGSGIGK